MSNETKRDVFDKLLSEYVDDERRIDGLVYEPDQHIAELDREYFINSYAAALPDDLPVIPKTVGRMITKMKPTCNSILGSQYRDYGKDHRWIIGHYDTFARAWLLSVWRVEETGEIVELEAEK